MNDPTNLDVRNGPYENSLEGMIMRLAKELNNLEYKNRELEAKVNGLQARVNELDRRTVGEIRFK